MNYLEDPGNKDNHDDVDGLSVDDNNFLRMLVRKASSVWRNYNADMKNALREWVTRLNAVPVSGMLEKCPQMFQSCNGGLERAIVKSLFHD